MPKFTNAERILLKSIVAALSIKRIPESEIIKEIFHQTNKTITTRYLTDLRRSIKKESYHWYQTMREGQYEYIHQFKERLDEIIWLQKKHYQIIDSNPANPQVQLSSMAELHRLNVTLSNYFDVAPDIIGHTIPAPSETKTGSTRDNIIV